MCIRDRSNRASSDRLLDGLRKCRNKSKQVTAEKIDKITSVEFKNVSYRYPNRLNDVIHDLDVDKRQPILNVDIRFLV